MAWMTNQWLKGRLIGGRGHYPVHVDLLPNKGYKSGWCKKHQVVATVAGLRSDGDYQQLDLVKAELITLVTAWLEGCDDADVHSQIALAAVKGLGDGDVESRTELAKAAVEGLDDAALLDLITDMLTARKAE